MPKLTRNFIQGKMNKALDERLVPNGEVIHAQNIRFNSTENSEKGVAENTLGNTQLTELQFNGTALSSEARTIGKFADDANNIMYWLVHDKNYSVGATGKIDLIVSLNANSNAITYHVISIDDGGGVNTTLNFNDQFLITGINLVDELLFFTDGLNQPRMININHGYAEPIANIDQFSEEEIRVIKAPPELPPTIQPVQANIQNNYMQDRFLSFAYRYRYRDNQYSATTDFTEPIFLPGFFILDTSSGLNDGMQNIYNGCIITYNTGGSNVVGIDLLFKEAGSNIIRVIEKIDKVGNLPDNTDIQYTFFNQKIFTILPESEILRLYDNVPRKAKAQTFIGNRIVYGNYLEGYDLVDDLGGNVRLEYEARLNSQEIGQQILNNTTDAGVYPYGGGNTGSAQNVAGIDLNGVENELVTGARISVDIDFEHAFFNGDAPPETTANNTINLTFILPRNYSTVFEMVSSPEFLAVVGEVGDIEPVATACNGVRLTDQMNCVIPNNLGSFTKTESGTTGPDTPILILGSPASNVFGIQLLAMKFEDGGLEGFEFYQITNISAIFQKVGDNGSLHSNRSYQLGVIYMDEYKRQTTALSSPGSDFFVPCSASVFKNNARVIIPTSQRPPSWASSYKFAIKADREGYETIFSTFFVRDESTNFVHFLLDGENSRKIEVGDRLTVKADAQGAVSDCITTVVLEKEARERNFLGSSVTSPPGVYMKLSANDFNTDIPDDAVFDVRNSTASRNRDVFPILSLIVNEEDPANPGQFIDVSVPAGSRIVLDFTFERRGTGSSCIQRKYRLRKTLISTNDYANFQDWFEGDNISSVIDTGVKTVGGGGNLFNTYVGTTTIGSIPRDVVVNYWGFERDGSTNRLRLLATGTRPCSGWTNRDKREASIKGRIQVFRAVSSIVWETQPQDTLPDVYFLGSQTFGIDASRQHLGNVQDQDYAGNLPAILDLLFINCYTFGNGVESYKIRDSLSGKFFNLGQRVTSVGAQEYKAARRFADLTWSGVYNEETNVNKLNEFNLGLLNFKQLERLFGNIMLLDARETDIRVLQEDKISYVLTGKNLLSDSVEGGAIASVPEVFGTQIARIEKYGISNNPESYARWGEMVFFTDAKRGAVLMLRGAGQNEQLIVISTQGMNPFFRDLFIQDFGTEKLGGYDPYMNEYVLTSNDRRLPILAECLPCGQGTTYEVFQNEPLNFCVNLQNIVGLTTISYQIISSDGDINIEANYDGTIESSGNVSSSGQFEFNKNKIQVNTVDITVQSLTGKAVVQISVGCPSPTVITIVEITLNNTDDAAELIHNEYRYIDAPFISPLASRQIQMVSGTGAVVISEYVTTLGAQGLGAIPTNGSTVRMQSEKRDADTFDFDPSQNNFRYLRTNTLYENNQTDIANLLSAANIASPIIGGDGSFRSEFTMPGTGQYLYMIWDYRKSTEVELCFNSTNERSACDCAC